MPFSPRAGVAGCSCPGGVLPVRMCAKAYLRVILSAGCLGPNTSNRKAVRLHRIPRKQKAAITRSSKMVWELKQ